MFAVCMTCSRPNKVPDLLLPHFLIIGLKKHSPSISRRLEEHPNFYLALSIYPTTFIYSGQNSTEY